VVGQKFRISHSHKFARPLFLIFLIFYKIASSKNRVPPSSFFKADVTTPYALAQI
jgi:hypothetical protein